MDNIFEFKCITWRISFRCNVGNSNEKETSKPRVLERFVPADSVVVALECFRSMRRIVWSFPSHPFFWIVLYMYDGCPLCVAFRYGPSYSAVQITIPRISRKQSRRRLLRKWLSSLLMRCCCSLLVGCCEWIFMCRDRDRVRDRGRAGVEWSDVMNECSL